MEKHSVYPLLFLLSVAFLFTQCQNKKNVNEDVEVASEKEEVQVVQISYPIRIDKKENYDSPDKLFLQDIGTVRYLQLETTEASLLPAKRSFGGIHLTDNDIFLSFGEAVFHFSSSGKFLNTIGRRGGGPAEFASGSFFDVLETSQEVFLLDFA